MFLVSDAASYIMAIVIHADAEWTTAFALMRPNAAKGICNTLLPRAVSVC